MKNWKNELVKAMVAETTDCKIVLLRDVAAQAGINHIKRQDAMEVMRKAAQESGYRIVALINGRHDSFYQAAALIEDGVEFEEFEEDVV